jgi:hypothetical protein
MAGVITRLGCPDRTACMARAIRQSGHTNTPVHHISYDCNRNIRWGGGGDFGGPGGCAGCAAGFHTGQPPSRAASEDLGWQLNEQLWVHLW